MAISKSKRTHKERAAKYKENMKKQQQILKKKLIDNYIKMQQDMMASQEEHTSTHEVNGPDINIDDLNNLDISEISDVVDSDVMIDEKFK